jgi:hypothetical protein
MRGLLLTLLYCLPITELEKIINIYIIDGYADTVLGFHSLLTALLYTQPVLPCLYVVLAWREKKSSIIVPFSTGLVALVLS